MSSAGSTASSLASQMPSADQLAQMQSSWPRCSRTSRSTSGWRRTPPGSGRSTIVQMWCPGSPQRQVKPAVAASAERPERMRHQREWDHRREPRTRRSSSTRTRPCPSRRRLQRRATKTSGRSPGKPVAVGTAGEHDLGLRFELVARVFRWPASGAGTVAPSVADGVGGPTSSEPPKRMNLPAPDA